MATIRICGRYEDWDEAKLEAVRESSRRTAPDMSLYAFDEGWLSQWAHNATDQLHHMIGELLASPTAEAEMPYHCERQMGECKTQYGSMLYCRSCNLKVGYSVFSNWRAGRGRRDLGAEGVEMRTETYRRAIDMNQSGIYFFVRESAEPLRVTAAQMGLGA